MGVCVTKQSRTMPEKKNFETRPHLRHIAMNRNFLMPEIRQKIFEAKDRKAPLINLQSNSLYKKRLNRRN